MLERLIGLAAAFIWVMPAFGQGLVARYEFENNVLDSVGNAHGTITGSPTYTAGKYGQAIRLDNLVDTVRYTGVPTPSAITVSLWVKLDPTTPSARYWFLDHIYASGNDWYGWQFKTEKLSGVAGQILWILADAENDRQTTLGAANNLFDGQWHHIAGTHDGTATAALYFDGNLIAKRTGPSYTPGSSTRAMSLINRAQSPQSGISQVDDITIWNRAFSAVEVADLFQDACINVTPGPVHRYHIHRSGSPVTPAVFTVTNTGEPGQNLTYAVQEVSDRPWLTLDKTGGSLAYLAGDTVTASIQAAGLAVGEYTCDLRFTNSCSPAEEAVLRVTLSVENYAGVPFVISYYDNGWMSLPPNDVGYSTLAACGMNVVNRSLGKTPDIDLPLALQYGLMGMVDWEAGGTMVIPNDPPLIDAKAQSLVNQYSAHPALLGYRLRDEPNVDEFPQIGMLHQKLLQYDPTCLPWVNILPNYSYEWSDGVRPYGTNPANGRPNDHKYYMDQFMTVVQPRVLCYDEYTSAYNTAYPENIYPQYHAYSNLERFREYSLAYNVPFWRIIESNLGDATNPPPSPNTEGIYRQQIFTSLAYGATGILYFTYTQQNGTQALVYYQNQAGPWGTPTASGRYQIAQQVHREVNTLAPLLKKLTSTRVCHTDPPVASSWVVANHPADAETFNGLAAGSFVTAVSGGQMLVGEFQDPARRAYLMLVNKDYVNAHTFTVQLAAARVAALRRVSKTTGELVPVATPGGVLSLTLSAGNGELYRIVGPSPAADFDGDEDVDQDDFGHLQACYTGAGESIAPNCQGANLDGDDNIDPEDAAIFQACMSGADKSPDPACAD